MISPAVIAFIGFIIGVAVALALDEDYEEMICREGERLGYPREYVEFVCRVWELRIRNLIRHDP